MPEFSDLKTALKRGALVTAANWPVVVIQFVTESTFKMLLAVPLVGGAVLVALLIGSDVRDLLTGNFIEIVPAIVEALVAEPIACLAFVVAFGVVLLGGSALTFLVKGGTVSVLVAGDATAGAIERPPLRWPAFRRAAQFGIDPFLSGCGRLFRRYLRLGFVLLGVYALSAAAYLTAIVGGYRAFGAGGFWMRWGMFATLCSSALVVWLTIVNQMYLLVQMVAAVDDRGVRSAFRQTLRFLRDRLPQVGAVCIVMVMLALLATIAALVATTGLSLIAFVPLAGLAVFPLQMAAWLVRGLVFQYLGLTALGAYLTVYRAYRLGVPLGDAGTPPPTWMRTA